MYAIIKTGGKQYKVQEGDVVYVEKLGMEDGASWYDSSIFSTPSRVAIYFA